MVNVEINKSSLIAIIMVLVGLAIAYVYGSEVTFVGALIAVIATAVVVKSHYQYRR
jgi:uncharacterized membrane protein